ncbi:MAG: Thioredoxin reductase [Chlamydiae bacterium]|nr:Thioredoxin reductase [Chlamydiota bacterium]
MRWIFLFLLPFFLYGETIPVVVIGSGPAGLSSALITARDRVPTTVFCGSKPGGPLNAVTCCGNWPGSVPGKGNEVLSRLFAQVKKLHVNLIEEEVVAVDFSRRPFRLITAAGKEYFAESVIIATGARQRPFTLPGEEDYWGRGIQPYLYKTDGAAIAGKKVVIVGSGLDASKKGAIAAKTAKEVTVVVRGSSMQRPFMDARLAKARVLYESELIALQGDGEKLTGVFVKTPRGIEAIEADLLIPAIGLTPNTELFQGQIPMDAQGLIFVGGRSQKTLVPGVFAAGTAVDGVYRQAAISAGDGMKAGYDALEFLRSTK